jgi:predicted NUDIX family NTP pyrophosphohydrolase
MPKQSAGIALYRQRPRGFEVLLVHPGGPFWAKKDKGAWSFPKGEYQPDEDPLAAAKREFAEEIGSPAPEGDYQDLGEAKQSSGKVVRVWALAADFDIRHFKSNTFEVEWPPKSGTKKEYPENDKAAWVSFVHAKQKLVKGQVPLLERLAAMLDVSTDEEPEEIAQTSLF